MNHSNHFIYVHCEVIKTIEMACNIDLKLNGIDYKHSHVELGLYKKYTFA